MSSLLHGVAACIIVLAITSCDDRTGPTPTPTPTPVIEQLMMQKPVVVEDRAQLEEYLDRLESQARDKGRVTALEVEPGLSAIALLEPELGPEESLKLQTRFANRMMALSLEGGKGGEAR